MFWRRNMEGLMLQLLGFAVIAAWWPNPWVIVAMVCPICYAPIHGATRDGEIGDWLVDVVCFAMLNRPVLTVVAALVWLVTALWRGMTGDRR